MIVIADETRAKGYRCDGVLCNGETYIPHVCTPREARSVDLLIFATKVSIMP